MKSERLTWNNKISHDAAEHSHVYHNTDGQGKPSRKHDNDAQKSNFIVMKRWITFYSSLCEGQISNWEAF